MNIRVIVSILLALCLGASGASASSIGVFFAKDGSDCDTVVNPAQLFSVYVIAFLGGDAAAGGITGAEFRVDNFDPQWFVLSRTPNPNSNLQIGNPDTGGVNMAFPACQPPNANGFVSLYDFFIFPPQSTAPRTLQIQRHSFPNNPSFWCQFVTLCDEPVFTKLCVLAGEGFINQSFSCTVGLEPKSWSQVKRLFDR